MAMNYLEMRLRQTGNPKDIKLATQIARRLKERGTDIAFGEGEKLPVSDRVKNTGYYNRLKEKFGNGQYSEGLVPDALTFGDLWDLLHLYGFLINNGEEIGEMVFETNFHNIYWAADLAAGNNTEDYQNSHQLVHSLDRSDPLFQKPINLNRLMENPSSPSGQQFELGHNNGITIISTDYKKEKYIVIIMSSASPLMRNPHVEAILEETGLPVR